jgi:SAM-dependent methyltransferase
MKSLLRRKQLSFIQEIKLFGKVIDLGSKSKENHYYTLLDHSKIRSFTFTDFYHESEGVVKVNLEGKFKLEDNSFDNILLFNVLEHIYNERNLIEESYRICREGGFIYVLVPFLWHFHKDPYDYKRYTSEALEKLLSDSGWNIVEITPTVSGRLTASYSLIETIFPNFIRAILEKVVPLVDRILSKFTEFGSCFVVGYTVVAKK